MKKIILILIFIIFFTVGCTKKLNYEGTYSLVDAYYINEDNEKKDLMHYYNGFTMTFAKDGKLYATVSGEEHEGSYVVDGNTITITTEEGIGNAEIVDNVMTMVSESSGRIETYIFHKQK